MGEIINYTRVTTSDRLEDRFLTCQVYEPVDPEQASAGKVFSQIEILNPWFPTSQIGQTVINTLIREYYRASNSSDLVNFENAIKKVNEALAQIAQNGETEWIGKFSGILMLVNGQNIHIAQTGQSRAYLFRGSKINHITEGLAHSEAPHPLKTFTNLTSGVLQQDDKIIIGNSTLFEVFSPSELRIPATSYRPMACAIEIARGLKRRSARSGNAVILELTTKEELANLPPEQKVDTIYLDKSGFDLLYAIKSGFALIAPSLNTVRRLFTNALSASKKTLSPKIKNGIASSRESIGAIANKDAEALSNARERSDDDALDKSALKTDETVAVEAPENILKKVNIYKRANDSKKMFSKMKNKFRRFLISSGFYSKNKSRMIMAAIVVFVIILLSSIAIGLNVRNGIIKDKDLQTKSTKITSLSGEASSALAKNQVDQAIARFQKINSLFEEIKGTKYEQSISETVDKSRQKLNELIKLTSSAKISEYDTNENAKALLGINGSLFYINRTDGIFSKDKSSANFEILINQQLQSDAISSIGLDNSDKIAFLLEDKKLQIADIKNKTIKEQSLDLEGGSIIKQYLNNLYVLDTDNNQIWRSIDENGAYSQVGRYIRDETVIAGYIDMAIDGSIFLLNDGCEVLKLSRGQKDGQFTVNTPDSQEGMSGCRQIITSPDQDTIFIAQLKDGETRIIETDKSGNFIRQFVISEIGTFEKVIVNNKEKKIFIQSGPKIFEYGF